MLEAVGVDPKRILEVRGMADRQLRVPSNPLDPANRRISILLPFTVQEGEADPADIMSPNASVVHSST
jgi:chemotaxis protein MotB